MHSQGYVCAKITVNGANLPFCLRNSMFRRAIDVMFLIIEIRFSGLFFNSLDFDFFFFFIKRCVCIFLFV